jgi:hypothetical protein
MGISIDFLTYKIKKESFCRAGDRNRFIENPAYAFFLSGVIALRQWPMKSLDSRQ